MTVASTSRTMAAAVFRGPGVEMAIEQIPMPRPGEAEVLLRVEACGVCHTDLHVMKGDVAFPCPAVLGHEVAGVVEDIGPRSTTALAVGDTVVTSFIMPCGSCRQCFRGREDLCETFFAMNRLNGTLYDGTSRLSGSDGTALAMYSMAGLAEYAVVPETAVFRRPGDLAASDAAILGCAFFTAYGAVRHTGDVHAGDRVVVVGGGGVGLSIVQLAAAFGAAEIIVVDIDDDKLAMAAECGATNVVNSAGVEDVGSQVREISGGGVDIAFEAVGLPQTVVQASEMVRDAGRVVMVGIGSRGATAPVEITRIVRRGLSISGSYGGRARTDMPELLRLVERGEVRPGDLVRKRYALTEAAHAYESLERGEITGRAVIMPGS